MKAISFMRLRVITNPKELLAVYKPSELSVEQKYDGHKAEAAASRRGVKIYSRNGVDITARVPEKVERLEKLIGPTCSTVLGEMIYVEDGKQDLQKVQSILHTSRPGLAAKKLKALPGRLEYIVYDLLEYKGKDITSLPLVERQKLLRKIIPSKGSIRTAKRYTWAKLDQAVKDSVEAGGEGAVIKVKGAPYKYRKKGEREPWGLWWKYKITRHQTSDVIITKDYRKGKAKLVFKAYQIDRKDNRVEVGRLSGLDKKTEAEVKKIVDSGKEIVAEVSHQGRRASGKLRDMGWVRLRPDKPASSATMELVVKRKRKKKATMSKSKMANPRKKRASRSKPAKPWTMYLIYEEPNRIILHSFNSIEHASPGMAAYERMLSLKAKGKDGDGWEVDDERIKILTEKELARRLRKDHRKLVPASRRRVSNPRRSLVKEALQAEAVSFKKFEDFSTAYWNSCSRGIYWFATNDRNFVIGDPERKMVAAGKFFVSCNPELALAGKNEGKKYVAELNVNLLDADDFTVKRGSASTSIKIKDNLRRVRVMRTMPAKNAKRAFKYQQGILPSSKEQLRKFWECSWEKHEAKKLKARAKAEKVREREEAREKRLAREEKRAKERRETRKKKAAEDAKKERVKRARKAKTKRDTEAREAKKAAKKKAKAKKNPGKTKRTAGWTDVHGDGEWRKKIGRTEYVVVWEDITPSRDPEEAVYGVAIYTEVRGGPDETFMIRSPRYLEAKDILPKVEKRILGSNGTKKVTKKKAKKNPEKKSGPKVRMIPFSVNNPGS